MTKREDRIFIDPTTARAMGADAYGRGEPLLTATSTNWRCASWIAFNQGWRGARNAARPEYSIDPWAMNGDDDGMMDARADREFFRY